MEQKKGLFHRDQKRIDDICWALHNLNLLKDDDIHLLAHAWGVIEDAQAEYLLLLEELRNNMTRFSENPKDCWQAFLYLTGWYDELHRQMRSATKLILKITKAIERRFPDINPEEEQ